MARFDTRAIHCGSLEPRLHGAVTTPIFQSATFEYHGPGTSHPELRYARWSNTPNHELLHDRLASLEETEAALVTSSGMSAITCGLLSCLKSGDHFLAQGTLYGGTHGLIVSELHDLGIECTQVSGDDPAAWEAARQPNTKAFYLESLSNPLLELPDVRGAVDFCRQHGLVSLIDNTFPSPVLFRPASLGIDLVMHSATKYLNGHSDLIAGAICGSQAQIAKVKQRLDHFGSSLDPHACFLLERGMKTLGLRVRHQTATAQRLAAFLEEHAAVARVHYPGLPGHPQHARAAELFDGFGAMLSFELRSGLQAAQDFLGRLRIPVVAPSLGGVETLVCLPAITSHGGLTALQREQAGIQAGLVRLSVGAEDADDLLEDVQQALGA